MKALNSYNTISRNKSQSLPLWNKGFTIVELLTVVVIIAILATITIVAFNGVSRSAEESALKAELRTAANKVSVYKVNNESYPNRLSDVDIQEDADSLVLRYTADSDAYCITAFSPRNSQVSFYINQDGQIQQGSCLGHSLVVLNCPAGFIPVPGDSRFGTSDFCVMKYEAKNGGNNVPVSTASGDPWTWITQSSSIIRAQSACSDCRLISDLEWMTIAANVLSVDSNWTGGSVGSGYIHNGHVNSNPNFALAASSDDSDGLYGMTGGFGDGVGFNNRRTLTLTNGEVIWDLAGNVYEWTSSTITGTQPAPETMSSTFRSYTQVTDWGNLPELSRPSSIESTIPGISLWDHTKGIGGIVRNNPDVTDTRVLQRGGDYQVLKHGAGVLTLRLDHSPYTSSAYGFRVTSSGL